MKTRECWMGSSKDFCYLKDCLSPLTYRQRCFEKQKRPFTGRFCRSATVSLVIWKYGTDFFVRRTDSGIYDVTDETAFRIPGKRTALNGLITENFFTEHAELVRAVPVLPDQLFHPARCCADVSSWCLVLRRQM